jgi:hypothetical protein
MKSQSTMKCMMFCFLMTIVFVSLFSLSNSKLREIKQKNPSNLNTDELVSEDSRPALRVNKLKVEKSNGQELKKPKKNKHKLVYSLDSDAEDLVQVKQLNQTMHQKDHHGDKNHHKANHTDHLSTDNHDKPHHKENHTHHAAHSDPTHHADHSDHTHHDNHTNHTHHANHTNHHNSTNVVKYAKGINTERNKANKTEKHVEHHNVSHHSEHHNTTSHVPTPPPQTKYGKGLNTERGKPNQHEQAHPSGHKPDHSSSTGALVGSAAAVSTAGLLSTQIQAADEEKSAHSKNLTHVQNHHNATHAQIHKNETPVQNHNVEKTVAPVKSTYHPPQPVKSATPPTVQSSTTQSSTVAYSGPSSTPPQDVQYEPVEYVRQISAQGLAALYNTKE